MPQTANTRALREALGLSAQSAYHQHANRLVTALSSVLFCGGTVDELFILNSNLHLAIAKRDPHCGELVLFRGLWHKILRKWVPPWDIALQLSF